MIFDAGNSPVEASRKFVDAVAWGEHSKVWEMLGADGRATVLRVAVNRGMDEGLAARLRDGTATDGEQDEFLTDLVNGLRAEFAGNDIDSLEFDLDETAEDSGRAHVLLTAPLNPALGVPGLPVASVELSESDGAWRVERVVPRAQR